ncbi:GNAT family N-acetyltransferase [Paenibacillus beijingensis]|nr:GNAT family N-acetyltransferase [Paenibacillus beijingensis]
MRDEVPYNLLHFINGFESSIGYKASDGSMIFAKSQGHPAWLWISQTVTDDDRKSIVRELVHQLSGASLPGISAAPETAEMFAEVYSKSGGTAYHTSMMMESYHCPKVIKPWNVTGEIRQAGRQNVELIAEYMAGFSAEAFGVPVDPASQIPAAERAVETGNFYLWIVEGKPVSMANIAHRSPRHARINAVYTPPALRKNGFASAIVSELCSVLEGERLTPMLYADLKNPDSNKVYQNIGFVERGKIASIKFG